MARAKKIYTQEEINGMTEKRMQKLFADGRIDDDMVQRWYNNKEEEEFIVEQAIAEIKEDMLSDTNTDIEGTDSPINEEDTDMDKYLATFVRANRCTVQATEEGYVAHFYRTHKHVADIVVKTENGAHSNALREQARTFAIGQCPSYEIEWNPDYQEQAWERKYMKYATDEQAFEDATTLMNLALTGVADKLGYEWSTECDGIYAKATTLSYIEDGKYIKDGCWAWADITLTVTLTKEDFSIEIPMMMEMVSGQIKKCKITQTSLKGTIQAEQELQQEVQKTA